MTGRYAQTIQKISHKKCACPIGLEHFSLLKEIVLKMHHLIFSANKS